MIIDFHTHTFPDRIAPMAVAQLEQKAHARSFSDGTRAGLLSAMQRAGVDRAVVLPVATNPLKCASINNASLNAIDRDGLTMFAAMHPDAPDWREELDRVHQLGFCGVKLHPVYQGVDIDDKRNVRILNRCGELGLTVVIHAGADIGFPGEERVSPAMLRRAMRDAGPVRLIAAHMGGWRNWQEVPEMLLDTSVLLDTAFSVGDISPLDDHYAPHELPMLTPEEFLAMIRLFGSRRVVFGTDSPWDDMARCVQRMNALPLTDSERDDVMWKNALSILNA